MQYFVTSGADSEDYQDTCRISIQCNHADAIVNYLYVLIAGW